jgi:hypothetical protein
MFPALLIYWLLAFQDHKVQRFHGNWGPTRSVEQRELVDWYLDPWVVALHAKTWSHVIVVHASFDTCRPRPLCHEQPVRSVAQATKAPRSQGIYLGQV